ncbi:ATP-dependent DNA helicase [Paramuricea clavata]|uniref:ATP-dependent DNA helicase n=1 Tax=Paramuricea clavata TaxID=317549 RepID=A0A7D9IMV8_PARCT|nr:ATP-dependent DNA helicase [Paramuricea clavata]
MATFEECESKIQKLSDKLKSILPLDPENVKSFVLNGQGVNIVVQASSEFEAAVSFGYGLCYLGFIDSNTKSVSFVCEDEEGRICYYDLFNEGEFKHPIVVKSLFAGRADENVERENHTSASQLGEKVRPEPAADINNLDQCVNTISNDLEELLNRTLNDYFGFDNFRPLQKEIITATLRRENVLGVLGMGSGKSLTFMLPAVLASRPTLVVSPTKSLIDDLVIRCQDLNISCCKFTGSVPLTVQNEQLDKLPQFKLIFTTPEMLYEGCLKEKFETIEIERLVFDEAHTISSWGDTFRPVYKVVCQKLSGLECPKLLLSATVPEFQVAVLKEMFGSVTVLRETVFQNNLFIEVKDRQCNTKFYDELYSYIKDQASCGIIYCVLSNDVTKIHSELVKRGLNCVKYHGKLSESVKESSFSKWISGEVNVIIANSSFGMGIDKRDVRYVVHVKLPTSIDDYYQQVGRAGRDGEPATCCIYYNYSDRTALISMFKHHDNFDQQYKALSDIVICLEDPVQCRHKIIRTYYGEKCDGFTCNTSCDNCRSRGKYVTADGTTDALL